MQCRVCDSGDLSIAVDLGEQPRANHFLRPDEVGKEPHYPLRVVYCNHCQTAQLDYTIRKEEVNENHTYLSGVTKSLSDHFLEVAQKVDLRFFSSKQSKSCLDIGSNDGTQLVHYKSLGYDVLGVDPAQFPAQIANERGIPTLRAFYNLETAKKIGRTFDVINAAGVFFHLEELHSVTEAIRTYLSEGGIFVVQFIYVKSMMDNTAFDQIYHEHLLYYSLKTLNTLLQRHDLELFDAEKSSIHGGSIIGFASHRSKYPLSDRLLALLKEEAASGCNELPAYHRLAARMETMKQRDRAFLEENRRKGKRIFGLGAPVKGNTLLNYFGIGAETLEVLVEKNQLRRDLYSPGKHIPIVMEEELKEHPDLYYVLAWNFKREILKNFAHVMAKGTELYFPVNA